MRITTRTLAAFATCALVTLFVGCDAPSPTAADAPAFSAVNPDGSVNRPFRGALTTGSDGAGLDPACGPPPIFRERQVGVGEATALGRFSVVFTFCVDPSEIVDDGVLSDGESIPYWDGTGTYTAANGDQLIVDVSGELLPSTDPNFDLEFHDPFTFIGGTGRFANASGAGMTHSFVDLAANMVIHQLEGTLTMHPGSR